MFYLDAFFAPPEVRGPALRKAAEISAVMLVLMTLLCWDYGSPDVRGVEAREAMVVSAPASTRDAYGFYRLVLDVDGNGMRGNRRRPSLVYVPQDAPNLDSLWKGAEVTVLCRETPCKVVEIRQAGRTIVPAATLFEIRRHRNQKAIFGLVGGTLVIGVFLLVAWRDGRKMAR